MDATPQERIWAPAGTHLRWLDRLLRAMRLRTHVLLGDEALVSRARAGEHAAYDALVARHRDGVYAMALDSLGDERAAGEALCECMVMAHRDLGAMTADCSPRAWLYLHGIRAVMKRLEAPPGRYSVEHRIDSGDALRTRD